MGPLYMYYTYIYIYSTYLAGIYWLYTLSYEHPSLDSKSEKNDVTELGSHPDFQSSLTEIMAIQPTPP